MTRAKARSKTVRMKFTVRSSFGAPPAVSNCSWAQIVKWLKDQALCTIPTKEQITLCAFTEFSGGWKRENLGLEGLWALVLDFDKVPLNMVATLGGLIDTARAVCPGDRFLVHTTYQHGCLTNPTDPDGLPYGRFRVIYPCENQPLTQAQYGAAWTEACGDFAQAGHLVDPATGNPERTWYVPCQNPSAPQWARVPWIEEYVK